MNPIRITTVPRTMLFATLILTVGLAVLAGRDASHVRADAGFTSVSGPTIHELAEGGHVVQVSAVTQFDASVNIIAAPNPSIDWGDGSTDTVPNPPETSLNIQYLQCTMNCSGGVLSGTHIYGGFGIWTVRATYHTGCCISYSTSWTVSIQPPAQATVDSIELGVLRSATFGDGSLRFSPAPLSGAPQACPPTCNPSWYSGTTVTITAVPDGNSLFSHWTTLLCGKGGCALPLCSAGPNVNPCQITLPQVDHWSTSVYAVFRTAPDTTPPAITAGATTADGHSYSAGAWTNQNVTVHFSCADTGSPQSGIGTNTVADQTLTVEGANQTVTSTGSCTDVAGNPAAAASFAPINIDKTAPLVAAVVTTADGKPYGAGTWTSQAVIVSFTCTDTGTVQSGIATNSVATVTVSTEGANQAATSGGACTDKAGNSAHPVSVSGINIDKTAPSTTAAPNSQPNAAGWYQKAVAVALGAADNQGGSGVAKTEYNLDAAGWQPYSQALTVSADGKHVLQYRSTDTAGNQEQAKSLSLDIDTTPPILTASAKTADGKSYSTGMWTNQGVTVTFACTDALSGVASVTGPVAVTSEGADQQATGSCTDKAGNGVNATFSGIRIDKAAPKVSCSVTPTSLWPPNHQLVAVTVTVSVADDGSGPAGIKLLSVTSNEPLGAGDIQGFMVGTASTSGQLRADRAGSGSGRLYILTYQGADAAGNTATCTATVTVPHDQGH